MKNEKISSLAKNPEYITAMTQFMTDPAGVLRQYGHDPNFMGAIQEFAKMTGRGDIFDKHTKPAMSEDEIKQDFEV